uniref:arginase family protein n=1 Tax=Nocardia neocaledoniensis TaxID=236511 RepID=UPI0024541DBF
MTFESWTGRVDGDSPEHLRWHQAVTEHTPGGEPGACVFVGFASEAGVRRNKGRPGAAQGPDALRRALSPMALRTPLRAYDAGTVTVTGDELEDGQRRLGERVSALLDEGAFPVVLGGGHEVAYGTYLGVAGSARRTSGTTVGILNLDAHFDLRPDPVPSSGTPFRQILESDADVRYAVLGISQPSNTTVLFDTAERFGVRYLLDDDCDPERARAFVDDFLADIDLLYLTIDLDVLPGGGGGGGGGRPARRRGRAARAGRGAGRAAASRRAAGGGVSTPATTASVIRRASTSGPAQLAHWRSSGHDPHTPRA